MILYIAWLPDGNHRGVGVEEEYCVHSIPPWRGRVNALQWIADPHTLGLL